jgi:TonB-dependent SusC/RagA subfamily outer membrane receptor
MSLVRRAAVALLAAVALTAASTTARAQDNSISGRVRVAGTSEPVPGAQITVSGGTQRAVSDSQGAFRITGITGSNVTLDVRRIGYRSERIPARAGQTDLVINLVSTPANLDAVVVTGNPSATQRREIGNSVGVINAADVVETAPILSMQGLLNGRTPSLVVLPTSGQVGTGAQVRIRGQARLSLGNNPLLFVDGVRVNNQVASGPVSQAFGSSPISRLNDFNPSDIESIEVLKGPSATTLYGTEAANGVINIITKKGAAAAPRWNFATRQGVNYFNDWKDRFPVNYGRRRLTTDAPSAAASGPIEAMNFDSLLVGACGDSIATRTGKKCDYFKAGRRQETELSVSGGAGLLNYFASGALLDDKGAEPRSARRNYTGRVNVNFAPRRSSRSRRTSAMSPVPPICRATPAAVATRGRRSPQHRTTTISRNGTASTATCRINTTRRSCCGRTSRAPRRACDSSINQCRGSRIGLRSGATSRTRATTSGTRGSTRSNRSASGA